LWTDGEIHPGESPHHFLPGFGFRRCLGIVICEFIMRNGLWWTDKSPGFFQFGFGIGRRHEAKVPDFDEPRRKDVQEKATDKLLSGGRHQPLLTGSAIVPGSEGDLAIRQANQSMIGNGHPVGVAAKVMIGFLGAIKKLFGVDDPFFPFELPEEPSERHRTIKTGNFSLQSALLKNLVQGLQKFRPDNLRKCFDGQEETVAGGDPGISIGTQPAPSYHDMEMGMKVEVLIPGVEHCCKADLGSQTLIVPGKLPEGAGSGCKEEIEDEFFVEQGQGVEFVGQGDHQVKVVSWQESLPTFFQPLCLLEALALRTVAIAAGVI
jgi:hypothetical protein